LTTPRKAVAKIKIPDNFPDWERSQKSGISIFPIFATCKNHEAIIFMTRKIRENRDSRFLRLARFGKGPGQKMESWEAKGLS
jgi:hypothetical protein